MKGNKGMAIGGIALVLFICTMLCLPTIMVAGVYCDSPLDMLSWFTGLHCPNQSDTGTTIPPGDWDIVNDALADEFFLCPQVDQKNCLMQGNTPVDLDTYNPNDPRTVELPFPDTYKSMYFDTLLSHHLAGDPPDKVQCVNFVETTYQIAKHPLPVGAYYADEYWNAYKNVSGWQELPNDLNSDDAPIPGDIVVWSNTKDTLDTNGKVTDKAPNPGHVAIVVATDLTTNQRSVGRKGDMNTVSTVSGSIYVAQGNAPGNYLTKAKDPLFPFPVPAGIPLLKLNYGSDGLVSSFPDTKIMGFIDNPSLLTEIDASLPTDLNGLKVPTGLKSPYVSVAEADATKYGYNPTLFVRQINQESGFNPQALSSTKAAGIAQFEPDTAKSWGLNIDGNYGGSYDPNDQRYQPVPALDAAARMMAHNYQVDLHASNNNQTLGYEEALADYNCGCGASTAREYGSSWIQHLPGQTQDYIKIIMGT